MAFCGRRSATKAKERRTGIYRGKTELRPSGRGIEVTAGGKEGDLLDAQHESLGQELNMDAKYERCKISLPEGTPLK